MTAWRALFAVAVLRLGIAPGDVWSLSAGEWSALAQAAGLGADALGAADLETLVQQYPDETS